jgi:hypothetical protein
MLERHFHALSDLLGHNRYIAGNGSFEIIENWQQIAYEGILLGRGLLFGITLCPLFVIFEVSRKEEVCVLLHRKSLL